MDDLNAKTIALHVDRLRVADFAALTKPGLTLMSVATAVGGAYLALPGTVPSGPIFCTLLGTLLVGGGACSLNQYIERSYDALMRRTAHRPIPAGRITPFTALIFGSVLSTLGIGILTLMGNPLAGFLAVATLVTYLMLYTPLKRVTPFATVVGAIPGALPPMIGWAVAANRVSLGSLSLFAILFFWQIPHFLALAWMYRSDYARGGFKLLTLLDPSGSITSRQVLAYSIALLPASVLPTYTGVLGPLYFVGAAFLSVGFLLVAVRLFRNRSNTSARLLFLGSLFYLPVLVLLMVLDRV